MNIDIEELQKNTRILVAIFEEAHKARLNANKRTDPSSSNDGQHDISMELTGGIAVDDAHLIFTKTLENYDWNLEQFFLSAANPQMDLFHNKDWKALEPSLYKETNDNQFLSEYIERGISNDEIKSGAKKAMTNIDEFVKTLQH